MRVVTVGAGHAPEYPAIMLQQPEDLAYLHRHGVRPHLPDDQAPSGALRTGANPSDQAPYAYILDGAIIWTPPRRPTQSIRAQRSGA
jgi:hypothetical protein